MFITKRQQDNQRQESATNKKAEAGDAWTTYIKQFPKLEEIWNKMPEVGRVFFAQQIDIFAGKYPASASEQLTDEEKADFIAAAEAEGRKRATAHNNSPTWAHDAGWFRRGATWARFYLQAVGFKRLMGQRIDEIVAGLEAEKHKWPRMQTTDVIRLIKDLKNTPKHGK